MATQDNLIFKLILKDGTFYESAINIDNLSKSIVIYKLMEDSDVEVCLDSIFYNVFIETLEENCNCEYKNMRKIDSSYFSLNTHEKSLYPGIYRIIIENKDNKEFIYKAFEVLPLKVINQDNYESGLLKIISEYNGALLFDFNRSKIGGAIKQDNAQFFILQKIDEILYNYPTIINSIYSLKNNPVVNLTKVIKSKGKPGKQNEKCLIKELTHQENKYYLKSVVDYNCKENQFLKYIIHESINKLIILTDRLSNGIISFDNNINKLITINSKTNKKIQRIEDEINKLIKRKESLLNSIKKTKQIIFMLSELEYNSFLKKINIGLLTMSNKFYSNHYYYNMYYLLYSPLCLGYQNESKNLMNNMISYANKGTSSLYEIFCLIALENILLDLGYVKISESSISDLQIIDNMGLELEYYSAFGSAKLIFDSIVNSFKDSFKDELVSLKKDKEIIGSHNRPDFQLIFFDNDNNIKSCIIADSKCRKYASLKKEFDDKAQLYDIIFDYIQFRYKEENTPLIKSKGIDELIILYPEEVENLEIKDLSTGISFISLSPNYDYKNKENYLKLKNIILKHL